MNILVTSLPDLKRIHPQRPHHLLKYLSKKHEITVLSVNAWWLEDNNDEYLVNSLNGINYNYISNKRINPTFQELFFIKNIKTSEISNYDLHLNFNSMIMGYFITKKMKKLGIPTVFDICDDLPEIIKNSSRLPKFSRSISSIVAKYLMNRIVELSCKITYVTPLLSKSYGFPMNKSVYIPNGVDIDLFSPNRHHLHKKNYFCMGFVGVINEWVDLKPVMSALKDLRKFMRIKLIIVGDGERVDEFKKITQDYEISDHVIFKGKLPYHKVVECMSLMDVCFISRKTTKDSQNSHPIKLFEYMALEKPVISTPLAGVQNLVGDMVFYASNSSEIKKRVCFLHENEDLKNEIGKRNREFIVDNYNWDKISAKFDKMLFDIK